MPLPKENRGLLNAQEKCETGRKKPLPPKKWGSQGIANHQSSPGEGGIRGAPLDFLDLIRSPKKAKHTWVNLQLPPQTRLPIPVYWVSMGKFM